jgi:hypothetical protein
VAFQGVVVGEKSLYTQGFGVQKRIGAFIGRLAFKSLPSLLVWPACFGSFDFSIWERLGIVEK